MSDLGAGSPLSLTSSLPAEITTMPSLSNTQLAMSLTTGTPLLSSLLPSSTFLSATSASSQYVTLGAEGGECRLLGKAAIFVQGALGVLALSSLVFKRWRERPQRPIKIWCFDVSKQVVGSILLHIANLLMSMFSIAQFTAAPKSDQDEYRANPCSLYLLNLAIDTTIGIPILIILLRLITYGFSLTPLGNPPESLQSGNYGHPPRATWWLKQSFLYFLGLLGMKACVFVIFRLCPWIVRVGDWALKWTEGNETVQVFFVMLFFPLIMNALQYYIIDSFIKEQKPGEHEQIPSEDGDDEDGSRSRRERSITAEVEEDDERDLDGNPEATKDGVIVKDKRLSSNGAAKTNADSQKLREYDPAVDGETSSSTSSDVGTNNR